MDYSSYYAAAGAPMQQPLPQFQQQQQQQPYSSSSAVNHQSLAFAQPQHFPQQGHPQQFAFNQAQGLGQSPVSPFSSDPNQRFPPQQQASRSQWNGTSGIAHPHATTTPDGIANPQNAFTSAPFIQATPTASAPQQRAASSPMNMNPMQAFSNAQAPGPPRQPNSMPAMQKQQVPGQGQQPLHSPNQLAVQKPMQGTPATPELLAREQQRVTLLLQMNSELLWLAQQLQSEGKAGPEGQQVPPPPPRADDAAAAQQQKPATREYVDCLRCLQSNLAYLAQSNPGKPKLVVPPGGPAIMDAPPALPSMAEWYAKLKPLFPGWTGKPRPSPTAGPGQKQPPVNFGAQPDGSAGP